MDVLPYKETLFDKKWVIFPGECYWKFMKDNYFTGVSLGKMKTSDGYYCLLSNNSFDELQDTSAQTTSHLITFIKSKL